MEKSRETIVSNRSKKYYLPTGLAYMLKVDFGPFCEMNVKIYILFTEQEPLFYPYCISLIKQVCLWHLVNHS